MKLRQDYKIINNLNKLIKTEEVLKLTKGSETCFDVELQYFMVEKTQYNLRIKASKKTSSVYAPLYSVTIRDPEYKVLDKKDIKGGRLAEKDSALAKLIFNRLQRYSKSCKQKD